ncbi:MAG: D-aminoacyl-tRNA deacylase [Candidatus Izemoplasmatales bacterium]|jgi:D-tyrosyl-tRNA(Tyr) deacylase|nr:D-aminoacyl-tRNA deacylase [Candidatus Izemoplasmatales bacterium]
MRVLVQRVENASVTIDGKIFSRINKGYLLFVGFTTSDNEVTVKYLANKVIKLRVFSDESGKMNLSIKQIEGEILSISQFTLYADAEEGNRPSFTKALNPDEATRLYDLFNQELNLQYPSKIKTGIFQSDMKVQLINDGPVTILLERA